MLPSGVRRCLALDHAQLVYLFDKVSKTATVEKTVWNSYSEMAKKEIPSMNQENLCSVVRALCRADFFKPSLFTAIAKRLDPRHLSPRQKAQMLSDLSNLGFLKSQMAHMLIPEDFSSMRTFDLPLVITSLNKAGIRDTLILNQVMDELAGRHDIRPMGLAASIVGCAMLAFEHPALDTLLQQVPRQLYNFGARECLNVALALCLREKEVDETLMWALLSRIKPLRSEDKHQVCIVSAALQTLPNLPSPPFPPHVAERVEVPIPTIAPPVTTKFQRSAMRLLKDLHIEYKEEERIGPYTVDYFLPHLTSTKYPRGTVLEFDGFKHFYVDGIKPITKAKTWLKYRILHEIGYRIVQIAHFDWDHRGTIQRHELLRERLRCDESNIPQLRDRPNSFS